MIDFLPAAHELLWALAVIPLAAYLHGILGLGFVTIAMPLLVMVLDLRLAMVLTVPIAVALSFRLAFFGGGLRDSVGKHWYMPVFMGLGAISGAWIFQHTEQRILLLVIAGAMVLFLSIDYLKKAHLHLPRHWAHPAAMLFAFLAGNTETSVNMGSPFLLIFGLLAGYSPLAMVQLVNLCFFTGKLVHVITLSVGGESVAAVSLMEWVPGLVLVPVCLWICAFGVRRREKTHVDTYRRWLKIFLKVMVVLVLGKVALSS
jgi:hypothetical protein